MSAEFLDIFPARFERLENIDMFDTARAAAQHVTVTDEEQRGARKFLGNTRRNDAHKACVPVVARDHDDVAVSPFPPNGTHRLRVECVASLLALGIICVELLRKCGDFLFVVARKQSERRLGVAHSARRVDARRNGKGKRLRRDLVHLAQQCGKRGARIVLDLLQAFRHDVAVFVRERNAVRHGRQRRKIDKIGSPFADESRCQLERHTRAAKIIVRVIVFEFGIDDNAIGQFLGQFVVVGDDDVSALFLNIFDLFAVGNTAVDGDKQIGHPFVEDLVDRLHVHAVTLRSFGNEKIRLDAEHSERARKHRARADPVRVVIAEHRHVPAFVARRRNQVDRLAHALHAKGRKQVPARRVEKLFRLFGRIHSAGIENPRRRFRQAERTR